METTKTELSGEMERVVQRHRDLIEPAEEAWATLQSWQHIEITWLYTQMALCERNFYRARSERRKADSIADVHYYLDRLEMTLEGLPYLDAEGCTQYDAWKARDG